MQREACLMGVTKERVRQIEARAMWKLRQAVVPEMLPGLMETRVS
jgi:DNA-directed RNA polymerase sigma subunit (sigma70/sigma32)